MPGTAMLGGLLQGFSDVGLKKQDQEHQDKQQQKRDQLAVLLSIDPSTLDEKGHKTLATLLDGIYSGGKGGKGGKGTPGPFGQLFDKIGPMLSGNRGAKRPDGLANPVPGNLNYSQPSGGNELAQPGMQAPVGQPGTAQAPPRAQNPAALLRGGMLDELPPPRGPAPQAAAQAGGNVPQSPQNVPQGTIHPQDAGAGPTTLGQLYASQNPNLAVQRQTEARQAQADNFKQQWEQKHGPLSKEQEDELMEWTMGMPAGFARAGRADKLIAGNVKGADGQPYDRMERPDGSQYDLPKWERPAASTSKPTALAQKRQQRVDDYKVANPNATDAQASRAISMQDYTDDIQKRMVNRFRGEISENQARESANRLVSGSPTTKDARYVLRDAVAEAKERVKKAMADAKGGFIETGGAPGPDNGLTEEQLTTQILESNGFNPGELRKLAAGSAPRTGNPKGGGGSVDPNNPLGLTPPTK